MSYTGLLSERINRFERQAWDDTGAAVGAAAGDVGNRWHGQSAGRHTRSHSPRTSGDFASSDNVGGGGEEGRGGESDGRGRSSPPLVYRHDSKHPPSPFDYDVGIARLQRTFDKADWARVDEGFATATSTTGGSTAAHSVATTPAPTHSAHGVQRSLDQVSGIAQS